MIKFKVLFVLALVLVAGCVGGKPGGPGDGNASETGASSETGTVRVGVILPLTGQLAALAENMKKGMNLARDEINSAGGIQGKKLELVYRDSRLDATEGVKVMRELAAQGIPIVIGAVASSVTIPAVTIADEEKVVLLSAASTNPSLSGASPYFFRVVPSDAIQGPYSAEVAYNRLGARRVSIIYENNDYGVGLKNAFTERFKELGGEITGVQAFESGQSDFTTIAANTISQKPELVYIPGYYKEQALAIKELRKQGYQGRIITSEAFENQESFKIGGPSINGTVMMKPAPDTQRARYKEFEKAYQKAYGTPPGSYSDYAYDAVKIAARAIQEAGYNGPAIQRYLRKARFTDTITRDIAFDENGDITTGGYSAFIANSTSKTFDPLT